MTVFDEATHSFLEAITEKLVKNLQKSTVNVVVAPDVDKLDAKICMEVGASVLLGKHTIVFVPPGRTCSALLRKIAFEVINRESELPAVLARLEHFVASEREQ